VRESLSTVVNLALFDFDGTITFGDSWTPFMKMAVRPARLVAGRIVLVPVVIGYRLGAVSASTGRQLATRVGFQGVIADRVRHIGVVYATTVLPETVRPTSIARIAWHKEQGDRVVVVSASLDAYLNHWCQVNEVGVICTQLEEKQGKLTGRYASGDCTGAEKVRRIRERYDLSQFARIYAYGDSEDDREMLALAHEKYYRWKRL
jgi:HAD superfamily hydrolase (TIGR01490 family)